MRRFAILWGAIALGLSGIASAEEAAKPKTHAVTRGPFEATVTYDGWVHSVQAQEVILQPEEWSTFTVETAHPGGSVVKAGDPLVTFDSKGIDRELADLKFQIESGDLSIKQARIELELLEKSMPIDLEAAERSAVVAAEEWEHYQKIGETLEKESTAQSLKSVQEMLDGSREELEQLEKMYKADDLTEETEEIILKRARSEVERGEFMVKTSQVMHDRRLSEELPRERRQKEINRDREAQALAKARIALPIAVSQKKIELEKLQHAQMNLVKKFEGVTKDRALMEIKAPIDGLVMYGQAEYGRWINGDAMKGNLRRGGSVTPHQVIYTIIPGGGSVIYVEVPEKDRPRLKFGTLGSLQPTGHPELIVPCQLRGFSNSFMKEGLYSGVIEAKPTDGTDISVVTGNTCKVRLVALSEADTVAVPSTAVFTEEDDPRVSYVWLVVADSEPKKQPVTVGAASATRTQITQGLQAGDQILLTKPEEK